MVERKLTVVDTAWRLVTAGQRKIYASFQCSRAIDYFELMLFNLSIVVETFDHEGKVEVKYNNTLYRLNVDGMVSNLHVMDDGIYVTVKGLMYMLPLSISTGDLSVNFSGNGTCTTSKGEKHG